jgi:hypothetical protein
MSGFRHSEHRVELAVLVDLKLGTYLPPGVGPVPPTPKGTPLDVQPRALCVMDAGRITLLPLVIRDIPDGGFDAASPHGYPGPVRMGSEDPAFLRVELVAGLNVLREAGTVSALVDERSHQGATCPTPALCWA